MPWPPKQRTAIFLAIKRRKGEKAARAFMHRHGYGSGSLSDSIRRKAGSK